MFIEAEMFNISRGSDLLSGIDKFLIWFIRIACTNGNKRRNLGNVLIVYFLSVHLILLCSVGTLKFSLHTHAHTYTPNWNWALFEQQRYGKLSWFSFVRLSLQWMRYFQNTLRTSIHQREQNQCCKRLKFIAITLCSRISSSCWLSLVNCMSLSTRFSNSDVNRCVSKGHNVYSSWFLVKKKKN